MKKTALIIYDDVEKQKAIVKGLGGDEFQIEAYSADISLKQLASCEQPNLVFMAVRTLNDSLMEMISVLKAAFPIPLIVFVDREGSEFAQTAVMAGVDSYIVEGLSADRIKPITEIALVRCEKSYSLKNDLEETKRKLKERKTIERAKGMLMDKQNINEETAYHTMRKLAMDQNKNMYEVATSIISMKPFLN